MSDNYPYATTVDDMLESSYAQEAIKPRADDFVKAVIMGFLIPLIGPLLFLLNEIKMRGYALEVGYIGIPTSRQSDTFTAGLQAIFVAFVYNLLIIAAGAAVFFVLIKALGAFGLPNLAIGWIAIALCCGGAILRLRLSSRISAFINVACSIGYAKHRMLSERCWYDVVSTVYDAPKKPTSQQIDLISAFNIKLVLELLGTSDRFMLRAAVDADMEHNHLVVQLLIKSILWMSIVPAIFALLALGPWKLPAWLCFAPMLCGMIPFFGTAPIITRVAGKFVFRMVPLFGVVPLVQTNAYKLVKGTLRTSLLYGAICIAGKYR
jgi:hypothetical protein